MAGLVPFNRNNVVGSNMGKHYANMIDDFFNDAWPMKMMNQSYYSTFRLDVRDDEKEYTIEAEMPGVKKEDISVDMVDGRLTISLAKREMTEDTDTQAQTNYVHKERFMHATSRSVLLSDASCENITAKLEDGILRISVPKASTDKKLKRINVD
jgi:HSP20 family protein